MEDPATLRPKKRPLDPFRRALVRGLAVLLPPLLTIVILVWIWNTVAVYLLVPTENVVRRGLVALYQRNIVSAAAVPENATIQDGVAIIGEHPYHVAPDGNYLPAEHYEKVESLYGAALVPATAEEIYRAYVERTFLQRTTVIPVFLCAFLLGLYLLGKFLAAGAGRFFWLQLERIIIRLPLVRNVYSSVKQVTDFVFSEREIEYTRVVAVEYPRKGIWQLGFVTGEALTDIGAAANEPLLTVFFPCSPMPFTGFTAVVKRSETLDLNITMEQALQFMVSCGVVAPPQHLSQSLADRERRQSVAALPAAGPQG
ncbi:MAG TPA: DUF502 domain-containing protein [Lacipirellulaceae bacterium]|nr:DUF502 domain-containing protein [Lacipirellulaceae bacterium]